MDNRELTPLYFRYLVHLIRPFPDFDFFFIKPLPWDDEHHTFWA